MANVSLSDFSSFINQQIQQQEQIETCLMKLEALTTVALLVDGFYEISESILRDYMWVVSDLLKEAALTNQASLNSLLTHSADNYN